MNVYTLYDQAAELYGPLQLYNTDAMAIRAIQRMQKSSPTATEAQHPEHFTLFCIGEFDDQTGQIVPFDRKLVVNLASLKEAV